MQTYKQYIPDDLWDTFYQDSGAGPQYHVVRSFAVTCVMFMGLFLRQLECSRLIIEKKMLTKQQQQLKSFFSCQKHGVLIYKLCAEERQMVV